MKKYYFIYETDTNNDGEIQVTEAEAKVDIGIGGILNSGPINDLTGIEAFINLQTFESLVPFDGVSIDFSQNLALKNTYISGGQFTSIDLSQNTALEALYLMDNSLTSIDLSANVNLTSIVLDNNQFTSLVLPVRDYIYDLDLSNNQLTSIDLRPISRILESAGGYFDISNNPLVELLAHETEIIGNFRCNNTLLSSMDLKPGEFLAIHVSNNYNLQYIQAKNPSTSNYQLNRVERIYANNCPNLIAVCPVLILMVQLLCQLKQW